MFSDSTNEKNEFRAFNCTNAGIKALNFNTVLKELKLEDAMNNGIKTELFGGIGNTVNDKYDHLASKYGLTFEVGKKCY